MATTKLLTAEDLEAMPSADQQYELVRGELKPMSPAGTRHSTIAVRFASRLVSHVDSNNLGLVIGADGGFVVSRSPDVVLVPDVGFIRAARLTPEIDLERFFRGAPDLAVEVVSPSDRLSDVAAKARQYLAVGTLAVWFLAPAGRTVIGYGTNDWVQTLAEPDELDGGDVVPGFRIRVWEIFR